ncbi:unnamed protein product [Auanema sp. JU1783]|nr:unnamed protein product [Auanema sp. JU1783]
MNSSHLCLYLVLAICICPSYTDNLYLIPTSFQGGPLMLPTQHKLQSLVSQLNNIGRVPHNEQATQVRKQLFSRKFWRR